MRNLKGSAAHFGAMVKLFMLLSAVLFFVILISPITLLAQHYPGNTDVLKLVQLIMSVAVIILPPLVLAFFVSQKPLQYLKITTKPAGLDLILVGVIMIIAIPFINLLGDLNQHIVLPKAFSGIELWMKASETETAQLTEKFVSVHSISGLFTNIGLIALIPALGEELFFRGALQKILTDWRGKTIAIWLSAILFSAIHFQFYGFIPRMLLGAFFGYLLIGSNSLWLPVTAHFINNAIAIIFYYFKYNGYQLPDIDKVGYGNTLWLGIASGALIVFGFFRIQKRFQGKPIEL